MIRTAIEILKYLPAREGSDADWRDRDAIEHLREALEDVEWLPPKDLQD